MVARVVCGLAVAFWVVWAVVAWRYSIGIAIAAAITWTVTRAHEAWRAHRHGRFWYPQPRGSAGAAMLFLALWLLGLMSGFLPTTPPRGGLNCTQANERMDAALWNLDDESWLGSEGRSNVQQVRMLLRSYDYCFTAGELRDARRSIEGRGIPW